MSDDTEDLRADIRALRTELQVLNTHRYLRVHNSWWRMLVFNLTRGLMVGLGGVIGATVLLSILVWTLSQVSFLPIIGAWATDLIEIVEQEQARD